jgi:hypothetical protein
LHDEGGDLDGVEFFEPALLRPTGRVKWEGKTEDGGRPGVSCGAARNAGAG